MEHASTFGEWLTRHRQSFHLSRAELAGRIGCAVITLRKIEIDERRPSRQMAEQLAEQLAIPIEQRQTFVRVARGELSINHLPPPATSLAASEPTNNLPHLITSLTGRDREIEEITILLRRPDVRLLTLTGAPGIGKTRLALGAATRMQNEFSDGVVFVNLAPLTDPELVLGAIAQTLQMGITGRQSLAERLEKHLRARHTLLVLDNFEHLLGAASQLTRLLEATFYLKLLVTSRIALELSGEHRLIVLPLAVPSALENRRIPLTAIQLQERYGAVDLFIQRAHAVRPALILNDAAVAVIGEICRKLDGLPLAIEFVAARAANFTPQELLAQLANHFPLRASGTRDLPLRHLSLWHALDWSYSLLSPVDQRLLQQLSVFVGGCTLEAIKAVCENSSADPSVMFDTITTLLNNSLLQQQEGDDGNSRFEMLETVREYASSQLNASGEAGNVQQRHAAYYLSLAQAAERAWDGPAEWEWLHRLIKVRDNLRVALRYALDTPNVEVALKLNAALFSFWTSCSSLSEAHNMLEATLALPFPDNLPELKAVVAKVRNVAGYVAAETLDNETSYRYFESGLDLYRMVNDSRGIAWSMRGCAFVRMQSGEYEAARTLLNKSLNLCESDRDEWGLAWSLYALAFLKLAQGDLPAAQTSLEEALVLMRRQNILFGIFRNLLALGYTLFEQGVVEGAEQRFREALLLNRETPLLTVISSGLEGLGAVAAAQGQVLQAARLWGAAEAMREVTGQRLLPVFQRSYDRVLRVARPQIGALEWAAGWAEGRALTAGEALSMGLKKDITTSTSTILLDSILPL